MASEYKAFEQWAIEQGITIHGVEPKRFPGRGIGLASTRDLKPEETIVEVPTSAILSLDSIPPYFLAQFGLTPPFKPTDTALPVTVHAVIAAYLAFHPSSPLSTSREGVHPWPATWPTPDDFLSTLPVFWPGWTRGEYCTKCRDFQSRTQNCEHGKDMTVKLLPPSVGKMVEKQRVKFEKDWRDVLQSKVIPDTAAESQANGSDPTRSNSSSQLTTLTDPLFRFQYCWSIVNTRCFYYVLPSLSASRGSEAAASSNRKDDLESPSSSPGNKSGKSTPFPNPDDNMALLPYLDLFNHVSTPRTASDSHPCIVSFNHNSYTFTSPSSKNSEESQPRPSEIYVSYGPHSQDFLFAEYGFMLPANSNMDDKLDLDPIILPLLTTSQRQELEDYGWLGDYTFYPQLKDVCFRTEIVALMLASSSSSSSSSSTTETSPKKKRRKTNPTTSDHDNSNTDHNVDDKEPNNTQQGKEPPTTASITNDAAPTENKDPAWLLHALGTLEIDSPLHAEQRESANGIILSILRAYSDLADMALTVLTSSSSSPYDILADDETSDSRGEIDMTMEEKRSPGQREKRRTIIAERRRDLLKARWEEIRNDCLVAGRERRDWF